MNETRKSAGARIIEGLDEVIQWTKGEGTMRMLIPGQPPRDITFADYCRDRARRGMSKLHGCDEVMTGSRDV